MWQFNERLNANMLLDDITSQCFPQTKKTPTGGLKDRISKRKSKSYSCMGKVKTSPEEAKKLLLMVPELKTRAASDNYML